MFNKISLVFFAASIASTIAHPVAGFHSHAHHHKRSVDRTLNSLVAGNERFRAKIAASEDPNSLRTLAEEGQTPPFMFLGCADSRVNDGTIFDAVPGTFFTERNIANQYHKTDINAQATLAYGLTELGVEHVIVMGHYGCGGVGASIASAPDGGVDAAGASVQNWIQPIRDIFLSSSRPEIVALRDSHANATVVEEPEIDDPGFKALVEENVKATVQSIASDPVIVNLYKSLAEKPANTTLTPAERRMKKRSGEVLEQANVFIHGLVYDITTGTITDLNVSVGPAGVEIPTIGKILNPTEQTTVTTERNALGNADIIHTFEPVNPAAKLRRWVADIWNRS